MKRKTLDNLYMSALFMELYLITDSGISINNGISMLMEAEKDPLRHELLNEINRELEAGEYFFHALDKTSAFPHYAVKMVETGEKTGRLDNVFNSLSLYYERQEQIRLSMKNATLYPLILILMVLFVMLIIVTKVLPVFNDAFLMLGTSMGSLATTFFRAGLFINKNIIIFSVILVALVGMGIFLITADMPRKKIRSFFKNTKLSMAVATASFASAMSLCLKSGTDIDYALEMAEDLCRETALEEKIIICRKKISEGASFPEAVAAVELLSPLYCQMIKVGFDTGSSDIIMEEVSKRSQETASNAIDGLLVKVEPILVALMSLFIGLILMSVMMPLMTIMTSIG